MIQCPGCKRILLDSTTDGGYKLRSRMVLFHEGETFALCPSCKQKVKVPVYLDNVPPPADKQPHIIWD